MPINSSIVDGYKFPYPLSDNKTYAAQKGLKGVSLLWFWSKIYWNYWKADQKLRETLKKGICYYGPFKGEFGHMTAHTMPFLMYLHKLGIKIIYCGMEIHKPLLVDEKGNSIIYEFKVLRDFFNEVSPRTNSTIPPEDVQKEILKFEKEALRSGYPFWNIGDNYYYWFIHRNWILNGHTHVYNLDKFYKTKAENACCIFPRSKGGLVTHNNGQAWDYENIIELIHPYFDKVYICGHPAQVKSLDVSRFPKAELAVSADNSVMLNKTSNSKLIITQHSGVNNIGEYVNTKVLIIYKGGKSASDIGSMNNTLRFRKSLGNKYPLSFAFSETEIVSFVKEFAANGYKQALPGKEKRQQCI